MPANTLPIERQRESLADPLGFRRIDEPQRVVDVLELHLVGVQQGVGDLAPRPQ